jgi:hypothetical protein
MKISPDLFAASSTTNHTNRIPGRIESDAPSGSLHCSPDNWPCFARVGYPDSGWDFHGGQHSTRRGLTLSEEYPEIPQRLRTLGGVSLAMAVLQSLCTAVFVVSGFRLAIGLTALAAVSGIYAPARGFHQDAIRIPMLIFATAGSLVNLAVLAWIWRLRSRPSAQWRKQPISPKQRRSERLQVFLAVVTLLLVGLETWTHTKIHRTGPPPTVQAPATRASSS